MNEKLKAVADAMLRGYEKIDRRWTKGKVFREDGDQFSACALGCVALGCGMEPEILNEDTSEGSRTTYQNILECAAEGSSDIYLSLELRGEDQPSIFPLHEVIWRMNDGSYVDQRMPDEIAKYLYQIAEDMPDETL